MKVSYPKQIELMMEKKIKIYKYGHGSWIKPSAYLKKHHRDICVYTLMVLNYDITIRFSQLVMPQMFQDAYKKYVNFRKITIDKW
ncbi:hypothetical protein SAMN02745154_00233 [Mycoplasmopsis verecunda]|uniref:Uncharacterized protein n=2 Tax=Mycoplasmopsis verecunda TaxID=171291 RepID=A0A1T4KXX8_9BACT|nr:hypothetical protein SAMN02745154_00233 [Mycoplasmopsis verecunda]